MRGIQIFRQLDFADALQAQRLHRRHEPIDRVQRRRQQLTRLPRVADLVRALAKEPHEAAPHVQPRAHSIAFFGRRHDADGSRQLEMTDPGERVGNHLRLQLELARIGDVRVQAAAAQRIAGGVPAIG